MSLPPLSVVYTDGWEEAEVPVDRMENFTRLDLSATVIPFFSGNMFN